MGKINKKSPPASIGGFFIAKLGECVILWVGKTSNLLLDTKALRTGTSQCFLHYYANAGAAGRLLKKLIIQPFANIVGDYMKYGHCQIDGGFSVINSSLCIIDVRQ